MSSIALVPTTAVDPGLMAELRDFVAHTFVQDTTLWPARDDLEPEVDPARGQTASTNILHRLLSLVPDPATRLMAITERDLFLPTLTFVFGHAQLEGQVAVMSLYRLRQENAGLNADEDLLRERACREVAHELGHTFGLRHCPRRTCCMSLSTSIEEVDAKTHEFCRRCRAQLRELQRRERARDETETLDPTLLRR